MGASQSAGSFARSAHSKGNSFFVDNKTGLILSQPLPTFAPHLKYRPRRFPNEICPVRSQCCPLLTVTPFIIVTNFVYGRQEIKVNKVMLYHVKSLMLLKVR